MKFKEIISEKKHVENLLYLRELLKLKIDNWTEANKDGALPPEERVVEYLENLEILENCLSLYPKVKSMEEINRKNEKIPYYLSAEYINSKM